MINIKQAIIVEGKYDKIKLSSIINGVIIQTNGFQIYKDKEKMELIRHYARTTGIIILTDSDSAGFKIRGFLKGAISNSRIINVYIPEIFGKERRKTQPSREGKLGVEGMDKKILIEAFDRAKIDTFENPGSPNIKRMDLYELGLMGAEDSSHLRKEILEELGLPSLLSVTSMCEVLNTIMTLEELTDITKKIKNKEGFY